MRTITYFITYQDNYLYIKFNNFIYISNFGKVNLPKLDVLMETEETRSCPAGH